MENVSEALIMAVAVIIFVIAVTILFSTISLARQTAYDIFIYTDSSNFHEHVEVDKEIIENGGREVSIDKVISNIYRCKKESFAVQINIGTDSYIFDIAKMSLDDLEKKIENFVKEYADKNYTFIEHVTEATTSGEYETASDGTVLTIAQGGTKIFITYTKK